VARESRSRSPLPAVLPRRKHIDSADENRLDMRLAPYQAADVHTVIVIAIGFGLLGGCALVGRFLGGAAGSSTALLVFLPLWLIGAGINMYLGVKRAGYSVAEELPIFLVVFAVPAVVALLVWWKLR
jgi:hypothetical protein